MIFYVTYVNYLRYVKVEITSYPPDNHHSSDDVYWRKGGVTSSEGLLAELLSRRPRVEQFLHRGTDIEAVSCTYVDSRVDCHAECPNIRRHTGHS